MNEDESRALINRFLDGIDRGDKTVMVDLFNDDAVIEWPASGEQLIGVEDRKAVYARTAVLPRISNRHIYGSGDLWIAEATTTYGTKPYLACLIFQLRDGRIARQVGYWSEPSSAPEWRTEWTRPLDLGARS